MLVRVCMLACVCSEGPHACAKGRGSVRWRDSDVQVVSNLEALRLQRHGVICALPARYSVADIFQPVHFPSRVGVDDGKAEVGPLFPGLWIHFLHQAGKLLQSSIHPCVDLQFTGGNIATGKFIYSVVSAAVGGEYSQQKGTGLQQK